MAIVVTSLGTAGAAGTATTQVLTITANVSIGDVVFAVGGWVTVGSIGATVSDSGGNSWNAINGTGGVSEVITAKSMVCTTALTSGVSTITITYTAGTSPNRVLCAFKVGAGGLQTPLVSAGTANNVGSGTAVQPGSVTPTFFPAWGLMGFNSNPLTTGTAPGTWTELADFGDASATSMQVNTLTNPTSSNTALNDTETLAVGSSETAGMQAFFRVALPAGAPARDTHTPIPFTAGAGGGGMPGPH